MPPSLQTVVRRMGMRPLAGTSGRGKLDAVVRWVAVSELADPTPYLEGDELLLTTGMRMEGDLSSHVLSSYVARLVARGVAGLGFGVGVSHEHVPEALIEAAEAAGLPLLEVPRETPFIAIGKAVSELLAAEQYEEISRAFAAQGRLTRAALRPEGMHAVIDRLAKEVGGWAALLDEAGEVRHATRGAKTEAVAAELARLRTTRPPGPGPSSGGGRSSGAGRSSGGGRSSGTGTSSGVGRPAGAGRFADAGGGGLPAGDRPPASLALSGPDEHIVVQPLGGGARPRGFFAVGAGRPFTPVAHTVINAAGSLLTLAMEQGRAQLEAARRVRGAVLELLLSGAENQARAVLEPLGGRLPREPLVVLAAGAEALDALEAHAFAALRTTDETVAVALVPAGELPAEPRAELTAEPTGRAAGRVTGRAADQPTDQPTEHEGGQRTGEPAGHVAGQTADESAGQMAGRAMDESAVRVAGEVAREADGPVGVSLPCGYAAAALHGAVDQARRALAAARGGRTNGGTGRDAGGSGGKGGGAADLGGRVVRFGELAGQGLLGLLDAGAAQAFSAAALAPLTRYGSRADLVESLRAYLESNGHWDAAAQRLGVHRHTLRYRMRRVAELLGRDLDDPGVRAELWLALEAARRH
ncbi:PucR family transcriptional regulator [Nonomuraea rosea]|uniref:PucR family transcriptional regulator n=1 Tax=Nonomuraea rosea TaxID=638574 RepID=A0ABP6ZQF1_9ACTN